MGRWYVTGKHGSVLHRGNVFNEEKKKLFFFWSQEFQRRKDPVSDRQSRVPTALERQGALYLDATWISAITGTALLSRRALVLPSGAAEEQRFPWEPRPED